MKLYGSPHTLWVPKFLTYHFTARFAIMFLLSSILMKILLPIINNLSYHSPNQDNEKTERSELGPLNIWSLAYVIDLTFLSHPPPS